MGKSPRFWIHVWFGFFDDKGSVLSGFCVLIKSYVHDQFEFLTKRWIWFGSFSLGSSSFPSLILQTLLVRWHSLVLCVYFAYYMFVSLQILRCLSGYYYYCHHLFIHSVLGTDGWETKSVKKICKTRIWHVPAKHANRMDARAHSSTLAECAPRFMTPRSQGFVGQSSLKLAQV